MERVNKAQLNNALTAADVPLQRSLSRVDSSSLLVAMEGLMRRYPAQDHGETAAEFFRDYERLALKYSLPKVLRAVEALRIKRGHKFFPSPDEVDEEIEEQRELDLAKARTADGDQWARDWEKHKESLMAPEEVAWRKERFGYDPYTEKG
jgi:hypothetical protein